MKNENLKNRLDGRRKTVDELVRLRLIHRVLTSRMPGDKQPLKPRSERL